MEHEQQIIYGLIRKIEEGGGFNQFCVKQNYFLIKRCTEDLLIFMDQIGNQINF